MLPLKLIGRRVPAGTPSEIIFFVIAAVIMALGLLPFGTEVRFILRLSGLILAAPGVALFALIVYPRETLLLLGACSMIAGRDGNMNRSRGGSLIEPPAGRALHRRDRPSG
jgi:hypothetical protein